MSTALAITYHDPEGRLFEQIGRVLPVLTSTFRGFAIRASCTSSDGSLALLASAGALVVREGPRQVNEAPKLGIARREAVALALQLDTDWVMYCDGDRVLHWADRFPKELARVVVHLSDYDFTVLGRTERAFNSHPRVQRDTESIINTAFQLASGQCWDVTAGARGLSRHAVEVILEGCFDEALSTDVSWPLFLRSAGGFSFGHIEAEGLEFETGDRYGEEIVAAGGYDEWMAQFDRDLQRWVRRLDLARGHVEAMVPFTGGP